MSAGRVCTRVVVTAVPGETVRTAAGLFDLSHMAEFLVGGTHAGAFLDYALAGQASVIAPGRAKYSLLLAEDGGILDDLVVYRLDDQHFWVVANAANHDVVASGVQALLDPGGHHVRAGRGRGPDLERVIDVTGLRLPAASLLPQQDHRRVQAKTGDQTRHELGFVGE